MNFAEAVILLFSVLCVLWAQCRFMGDRVLSTWRQTPHYIPLWIMLTLPAYLSALWPFFEWLAK